MRRMVRLLVLVSVLSTLSGCGASIGGRATGICRVRFGSRDPALTLPPGERSVTVNAVLAEAGHDVRVTFADCTLLARPAPDGPSGHYLIASGHCRADVPTRGTLDFDVADRRPDGSQTEDGGEQAFVNIAGDETRIDFEAGVPMGVVRYDCELHRAR